MKVWPVKHSPLLRQPERFIARSELQALIRNVTQNLVNITSAAPFPASCHGVRFSSS